MARIRICFIADHPKKYLGGAERQVFALATLMNQRGFDVSIISRSKNGARLEYREGGVRIREIGAIRRRGPARILDLVLILLGLARAIRKENAHVYYQRTGGEITGVVGFICRMMGRPFIFGSSSYWNSNDDLNGRMHEDSILVTLRLASPLYRYGLNQADAIVTQTDTMARQFKKRMPQRDVRHIPPIAILKAPRPRKDDPPVVLYISRLIWYRKPFLFLNVAQALPKTRFVLAGYGPLERLVEERAQRMANVSYIGPVTPEEASHLIQRASLFLNTSLVEGFPNTLLESLACQTPYVSVFDPDEVICKYGLGVHAKSFQELVDGVQHLVNDESERTRIAINGLEYLNRFHDTDSIASTYHQLFLDDAVRVVGSELGRAAVS